MIDGWVADCVSYGDSTTVATVVCPAEVHTIFWQRFPKVRIHNFRSQNSMSGQLPLVPEPTLPCHGAAAMGQGPEHAYPVPYDICEDGGCGRLADKRVLPQQRRRPRAGVPDCCAQGH